MTDSRFSQINTLWSVVRNANDSNRDIAQHAQRQLWNQYAPAARRYLGSALRNDEAVDEVMQELALKLVRHDFRNASPDKGSFRSFLKTVLFRMVADYHRGKNRVVELAPDYDPVEPQSAEHDFAESWREEILERTWMRLEELEDESGRPRYTVLRLKVDHPKWDSQQLAQAVGQRTGTEVTTTNFRVLLHRSREKFAELIVDEVSQTLQVADREPLQEELAELRLLEFCQSAMANQ